ncbi:MAG: hypothetical protein INR70_25945 [Parafilimonas terrae]|nr:hypothetical protein [Parafilimonas terrae]
MENGDWNGMSDRKWQEQTGKLHPVEAARAAVDRIAAGRSTLDEEIERIGSSHEKVRAQVEIERGAFEAKLTIGTKDRPDEFWWVRLDECMPLEPACVSFNGAAPEKVQVIGDDSWGGTPIEDFQWTHTDEDGTTTVHTRLELVERILPPGRAKEVADAIEAIHWSPGEDLKNEAATEAQRVLRGEPAEA